MHKNKDIFPRIIRSNITYITAHGFVDYTTIQSYMVDIHHDIDHGSSP